jgi:hypothetical protein
MRVLLVAALASSLVLAVVGEASPSAAGAPSLRMTTLAPPTVAGTGFRARERVALYVPRSTSAPVLVRATVRGTFTVLLPHRIWTRFCEGPPALAARGSRGSRAFLLVRTPFRFCPELIGDR